MTRDPTAPPARLLDGMLRGDFPFLLSIDLLAEVRTAVLVTGDRRLLTAEAFRGRAHSPAEALEPAGD